MKRPRFGSLRRVVPFSRVFGFDRGLPIDRYYLERFLARHRLTIRGRVLAIGDDEYTRRYGAGVTRSEVLHVRGDRSRATWIADLARGDELPSDAFDCILLVQTLQYIYDLRSAVRTVHRILRPGGVVLVSVPGISQLSLDEWGRRWYWSFSRLSITELLGEAFDREDVVVDTWGNVLSSIAFLHGLAHHELKTEELDVSDPTYPLLITARALKSLPAEPTADERRVSIVIPCFNQARFLGEAIDSVRGQTHRRHEVVVVDDGSDDGTAEVAARYSEVLCVRQDHRGLAAARNTGLRHATGDLVVFLDADDRLLPAALAVGLRWLSRKPECAAVTGHHRSIGPDGAVIAEWPGPVVGRGHYFGFLQRNFVAAIHTALFRREALDRLGGFDESLRAGEDYDLFLRLARRAPLYSHGDLVAEYRRHDASMTRDPARLLEAVLRALRKQWPHVRGRRSYRQAYREGLRHWRGLFGDELARKIRRGEGTPADLWTLLRWYPAGLWRLWRGPRDRRPRDRRPRVVPDRELFRDPLETEGWLRAELAEREQVIAQRDEGIAWLREKLAEANEALETGARS